MISLSTHARALSRYSMLDPLHTIASEQIAALLLTGRRPLGRVEMCWCCRGLGGLAIGAGWVRCRWCGVARPGGARRGRQGG